MEAPVEDLLIINRNTIYDLTKDIINEILETTLFFYNWLLTDEKEFHEAELIDEIPGNESVPKGVNEHIQIDKIISISNSNFNTNINSNDIFLNNCANKILKGNRLNIQEKIQIINTYKNNPIDFSIHKLSNTLNV